MKNKILALAAAALLAACSSDDSSDVNVHTEPGSAGDFKANHRDRVFFNFNDAHVSKAARKVLEDQATWLKTYSAVNVTVEGKCDARGTDEYNMALGAKRADAAKRVLAKHGVDEKRIKTVSYGKSRLEVPGDTAEAHAQNRVAITVVE